MANTRLRRCMRFGQGSLRLTMTQDSNMEKRVLSASNDLFFVDIWIPPYSYSVAIVCDLMSNWMVWRSMVARSMRTRAASAFELMKWESRWLEPANGVGDKSVQNERNSSSRATDSSNGRCVIAFAFIASRYDMVPRCANNGECDGMGSSLSHFTQNSFSQTTELCTQINDCFKTNASCSFHIFRHYFFILLFLRALLKWTRVSCLPPTSTTVSTSLGFIVLRAVTMTMCFPSFVFAAAFQFRVIHLISFRRFYSGTTLVSLDRLIVVPSFLDHFRSTNTHTQACCNCFHFRTMGRCRRETCGACRTHFIRCGRDRFDTVFVCEWSWRMNAWMKWKKSKCQQQQRQQCHLFVRN